ncbi:hypothetical protein [Larkinella arboricola]|nr:hypothetical protein [Larkinella arboricola]
MEYRVLNIAKDKIFIAPMFYRLYDIFTEHPLDLIAESISIFPLIVGVVRYRSLRKGVKFLILFFFIIIVRDFTSNLYAVRKVNNLFLYNLSAFFEVISVCLLFRFEITKKSTKKFVDYGALITVLLCVFFWRSNELSAGILTSSRLYELLVVLFYFRQLIEDMNVKDILKHSLFWISSGLILQFTGTFFVYLFANYALSINTESGLFNLYWNMNQIMYITFALFSSIGLWVSKYDKNNFL